MNDTSICSNCLHRKTCNNKKRSPFPILFCDEYAYELKHELWANDGVGENFTTVKVDCSSGICITCNNVKNCKINKAKPVVYCEEYN